MTDTTAQFAQIPMQTVGPLKITGPVVNDEIHVPLATFETPLWPSTNRGARVSMRSGGIHAVVTDDRMSRSVLLQAPDAGYALKIVQYLENNESELHQIVQETSRYAKFLSIHHQLTANLLYLRLDIQPGDASGHNMVTKAAEALMDRLLARFSALEYVSVSGNYCTDKKVSAVNGILGRGKSVVTEMIIPRKICTRYLKTTPEKIVDLNIKKNLLGSTLAGSLRSANAHFANILLAFYLATGQDAANIIEGSQGFVHAELKEQDLYISATLPNLVVGTVGSGKQYEFVQHNLNMMGCLDKRESGENARRLAVIAASAVLCGELSLMAALTNPGELMYTHESMER